MLIRFASWLVAVSLAAAWPAVAAITFTPGHFYTTDDTSDVIEYDAGGQIVGSLTVPASAADSLRGLAFGPDGLLYVTAVRGDGFAVLAMDASGSIAQTYPGSVYVRGNLSYGKVALDEDSIYVGGQTVLTKFVRGNPASSTVIYSNNQIFDVVVLPNGHLMVGWAYGIAEITKTGALVRNLPEPNFNGYGDLRGIEYVAATNKLFVTHLGYTDFEFLLMRVDAATGALEDHVQFVYANDLFLTARGALVVGSWTRTPRIYGQDLLQTGSLAGDPRLFVTEKQGCGDGGVQAAEECDDGNTSPGDGCDATCRIEPETLGIAARKLIVVDRPTTSTRGQLTFVAHDHAVTKGAGVDPGTIGVEFTAAYASHTTMGGYRLPAGDAGWLTNDAAGAKFMNRLAPAGTTRARMARIQSGKALTVRGRGVGDTPFGVHDAGAPDGSVFTAYCIRNGAEKRCFCSEFASCAHRAIDAGAGARLTCRTGVADPACTAIATTTTTTTSTSTTSSTSTTTLPACTFVQEFPSPSATGIAVDLDGNMYVVERDNDRVRKLSSDGTELTAWGTSGSADGAFNKPSAVALASNGDVYVTDTNNDRVQRFDANGTFLGKWGSTGHHGDPFSAPVGIAVDPDGNVWVTDVNNNSVHKFDAIGTLLGTLHSSPGVPFSSPLGVAADSAGHIYIADTNSKFVHKFLTDGGFVSAWHLQFAPVGIATDTFGNVYVSDPEGGHVHQFDPAGVLLGGWGSLGSGPGEFLDLRSLATDSAGNVYVADFSRIQKFTCIVQAEG